LHQVQSGDTPPEAKALKGIGGGGASVMEIVLDHHRDTYRAVYTAKLEGIVYVLHCFQKKSKRGIATPKPDIDTIERNLKIARNMHRRLQEEGKLKNET
jgi:phage-related protein